MSFVFGSPEEAIAAVGRRLGPSGWLAVDQARIDGFAEATGDHQWIHVDPVRAKDGPFGTTIAHGYLTLSLINGVLPELIRAEGMRMGINYGLDRVRFPHSVRAGSRVRNRAVLKRIEKRGFRKVLVAVENTMEIEGADKPAMVAEVLALIYL